MGQFPKEQSDSVDFQRQPDDFRDWISADGSTGYPAVAGRYHRWSRRLGCQPGNPQRGETSSVCIYLLDGSQPIWSRNLKARYMITATTQPSKNPSTARSTTTPADHLPVLPAEAS